MLTEGWLSCTPVWWFDCWHEYHSKRQSASFAQGAVDKPFVQPMVGETGSVRQCSSMIAGEGSRWSHYGTTGTDGLI